MLTVIVPVSVVGVDGLDVRQVIVGRGVALREGPWVALSWFRVACGRQFWVGRRVALAVASHMTRLVRASTLVFQAVLRAVPSGWLLGHR